MQAPASIAIRLAIAMTPVSQSVLNAVVTNDRIRFGTAPVASFTIVRTGDVHTGPSCDEDRPAYSAHNRIKSCCVGHRAHSESEWSPWQDFGKYSQAA